MTDVRKVYDLEKRTYIFAKNVRIFLKKIKNTVESIFEFRTSRKASIGDDRFRREEPHFYKTAWAELSVKYNTIHAKSNMDEALQPIREIFAGTNERAAEYAAAFQGRRAYAFAA